MGYQGLTAKGVPPSPPFLLYLKGAILILSVIVLAMAAWSIAAWNSWYNGFGFGYGYYSGVGGLVIFVVIKTWLIYGIFLFLEMRAQHYFFRIIALIAYSLSIIFWLSAWAWSASNAALWASLCEGMCNANDGPWESEIASLGVCAGLGAVIWVLSIVHLVFFVRACLSDGGVATYNQAELGQVPIQNKNEATATVYAQQQPVYQQTYPQPAYQQQVPPQPYVAQ